MIDNHITLKKFQIFLSFMQKGNIGLVAEELNLSNVSVHRALHTLEDDISCPLFVHNGRLLQPLPSAYTFAEYVKEILKLTEQAIEATQQAAGFNKEKLRVGTMYSLTLEAVPKILMDFKLRKPDISVDLIMGSNQELLEKLRNGQLDAILISISESTIDKSIFETLPLFKDKLFMAGPVDSPLLAKEKADLQQFKDQRFIALGEGFATYHSFNKVFANTNFEPNIGLYVNDIFSLINLVSAGVGFSLLPGRIKLAYANTIKMIPLDTPYSISQTIGLVFLKAREHTHYMRALAASCRIYSLSCHKPIVLESAL